MQSGFGDSVRHDREFEDPDDRAHHAEMKKTGFWGARGAGSLILARSTGRLLIAHRSEDVEQPHTWGTWGGAIDVSSPETPEEAATREVREECGYRGEIDLKPLFVFRSGTFAYYNFLAIVDREFKPRLDWETQGYEWCEFGHWPSPQHFGLKAVLDDPASVNTIKAAIAS